MRTSEEFRSLLMTVLFQVDMPSSENLTQSKITKSKPILNDLFTLTKLVGVDMTVLKI